MIHIPLQLTTLVLTTPTAPISVSSPRVAGSAARAPWTSFWTKTSTRALNLRPAAPRSSRASPASSSASPSSGDATSSRNARMRATKWIAVWNLFTTILCEIHFNWPYHKYGVQSKEGVFAQDCTWAEWILLWHVRQTHCDFHRHYTQNVPQIPDFTKKAQVSWISFIISNDLYTAHHNLLGIYCHQLKISHLYGTFNFLTQCICMGSGSLFVYGFRYFCGKACPLRRKTVFAVASI